MSKVDWSKAPEGATHYNNVNGFFYRFGFARCEYWSEHHQYYKPCSNLDSYAGEMIERPKQPQAWSGPEDGLPPVGMVLEYKIEPSNQWHVGEIRYHMRTSWADCRAIVWNDSLAFDQIAGDNWKFRKLRTEEEIAADKRETAIRELMDIAQVDCRVTAARLVDAGFKREVV